MGTDLIQRQFSPSTKKTGEGTFLQLYEDGEISPKVYAEGVADLKNAFPSITEGWISVLSKYVKKNKFSDKRFREAVDNLIETYVGYATIPPPAKILMFGLIKIPNRLNESEASELQVKYHIDDERLEFHSENGERTWSLER